MNAAVRYFGDELQRAREAAGLTQEQLAGQIKFSKSQVAMVETGRRPPKKDLTVAVDNVLGTDGRFERMRRQLLTAEANPVWFRPWIDYEQDAAELRWYEALLVPGLVQTEEYARAILGHEDRVAVRMDRQQVLDRASVGVIIEESVLRRRIGDRDVMHRQLTRLATTTEAAVQVLPDGAQTHPQPTLGLEGAFAIAVVDGAEVVYVDTPARGFVLEDREVVSQMRRRWEAITAEALPRNLSRELIVRMAEEWRSES